MKLTAIITTAGLALALLTGCGDDEATDDAAREAQTRTGQQAQEDSAGSSGRRTDISELVSNPGRFEGEEIVVTGDVEGAVSGPTPFALTEKRSEREMIVLPTTAAGDVSGVVSNEQVTVHGRVVRKTDDLAEQADFQFEGNENAGEVLDDIADPYVLIADQVLPGAG
jgi:hypothetical protein